MGSSYFVMHRIAILTVEENVFRIISQNVASIELSPELRAGFVDRFFFGNLGIVIRMITLTCLAVFSLDLEEQKKNQNRV